MDSKMRVIYIADQAKSGGAADALLEIVQSIRENYDVVPIVLTAFNGALNEKLEAMGIEYYQIGHRQFAYSNSVTYVRKMFRTIFRPYLIFRYMRANRRALMKAESVIDFENIDLIHTNVDRNDIGGVLARKYGLPHIWHLREHTQGHFDLVFNRIQPFRYMNSLTTRFIAISNSVRSEWIRRGIDKNKIQTVYDGDDFARIQHKTNTNSEKKLKIIFLGRISKEKGQNKLIYYVSQLEPSVRQYIQVDFWGDGNPGYVKKLKKRIRRLQLQDNINFCGYTSDVGSILKEYDIGVNCSVAEGFGRVTVEYMAAGLCTIVSHTGANCEIVNHGETGFVYHDMKEFVQLLTEVYSNREKLTRVAEKGYAYCLENYGLEKNIQQLVQIYKECLQKNG